MAAKNMRRELEEIKEVTIKKLFCSNKCVLEQKIPVIYDEQTRFSTEIDRDTK